MPKKGGLPRRAKSHHLHKDRYEELGTRAVLAAHNENVDKINAEALRKVPGESTVYEAIDEPAVDCPFTVPLPGPESFQHRAASGMPKHHLELKEGAIVMLCRSLDVEAGLCNGTKLIVTELLQHGVMCKFVKRPPTEKNESSFRRSDSSTSTNAAQPSASSVANSPFDSATLCPSIKRKNRPLIDVGFS
ncbi:hypothetical protein QR680_009145 [Steinernema hermaphroditum]|uniref:DNA helicase Pif1-like 2B domain-containing protein n=1 Tax=Steinernema hermaphroditum TaxID=289476 RepID=A0AA39IKI2_9BILA|nr:hypothetical protein QR680_009145 [Steinernema hermaphroditum]